MKKYRLLVYEGISGRFRVTLSLLLVLLGGLAVYDLLRPFAGTRWWLLWGMFGIVGLLWGYYVVLMRRAFLQIHTKFLRIQGPVWGMNVSYGRIKMVTTTLLSHHFPLESLRGADRALLRSFFGNTNLLVELHSFPPAWPRRLWWFSKFVFAVTRPGLLLIVDDWMTVSREIEAARIAWHGDREARNKIDNRSLAARILDGD